MGTFLGYYGDPCIPENQWEKYRERLLRLLDQGGMLQVSEVRMFGKQVYLLKKLEQGGTDNNTISFCYNYFEDCMWETAWIRGNTPFLCTEKVGRRQFNRVCTAGNILTEFYTASFGITGQDGRICDTRRSIGWLNHLFREQYTNRRVQDPWAIYRLLPNDCRGQDLLALIPDEDLHQASQAGIWTYLAVARPDQFSRILDEYENAPSRNSNSISALDLASMLWREIKQLKMIPVDDAEKISEIKNILLKKTSLPELESPYAGIFLAASLLPVEITLKYTADTFGLDFWSLLVEIEGQLPDDCECILPRKGGKLNPLSEITTADYLTCTDDDRAFWWEPEGDVHFSAEMTAWLKGLKTELECLAGEKLLPPMEVVKLLVNTLHRINEGRQENIMAFQAMFYDFLMSVETAMTQAAVRLLGKLDMQYRNTQDPEGAQKLRRYLAVMGNFKLRKVLFGF